MNRLTGLSLFVPSLFALGASAAWAAPAGPPPLSHDEIKEVVDSHIADLKSCMGQHGGATGKLVVEFGILPNGKVTDQKPKERSSNAALDRCITAAFAGWTFPKPRGGVTMGVNYPFQFSAPPPTQPAQGKLEDKQVVDTVHTHQADIDACAKEALKEKPSIEGTVEVALVVDPSGKVSEAHVHKTTTPSNKLDACLVEKLKTWPFPKPAGNGEFAVIYPFVFGKPAGKP